MPRSSAARDALLLGDELVEQEQQRRRRVDRHRRRDLAERDPVEQQLHVGERVDRDAGAPHLALGARVVGVEAELGRQVERDREPRLAARRAGSGSARSSPRPRRSPAYWRIVHGRPRYMSG